ncbi:MAG: GGDEF domain-containing protein [Proteobacteria bacterium]|nr:GGDEF domain-containing protein [Pseudomonadota bacterium]
MNNIKTSDFSRSNPASSNTNLVTGVLTLAQCLKDVLNGKASANAVGQSVGTALAAAQAAERLIAEQKNRLAYFEQLAITDTLTGLLNRRGFEAEIKRTMNGAKRYQEKGVLIYVDLDGFKPVNDIHGHAAGDAVLCKVSALLAENVRATDCVGRLGGDEFAILLTRTTWEAGLKRAEAFDAMINGALLDWQGETISISASFGFQTYGPDDDLNQLLICADDAMYISKRARTNTGAVAIEIKPEDAALPCRASA